MHQCLGLHARAGQQRRLCARRTSDASAAQCGGDGGEIQLHSWVSAQPYDCDIRVPIREWRGRLAPWATLKLTLLFLPQLPHPLMPLRPPQLYVQLPVRGANLQPRLLDPLPGLLALLSASACLGGRPRERILH